MEFTGERFSPEFSVDIALEQRHRYLLAALYAKGKDVLDLASGEGGGSALLAGTAGSVTGLEGSPESVAAAQQKYRAHNLRFLQGNAEAVPLPDASVDLVVSCGTVESRVRLEPMLLEIKRVLRPGGLLFMAFTPQDPSGCKDVSAFLSRHFSRQALAEQRLAHGSFVAVRDGASGFAAWGQNAPEQPHAPDGPRPGGLIALASDAELPPALSSVFEGSAEGGNRSGDVRLEQFVAPGRAEEREHLISELRREAKFRDEQLETMKLLLRGAEKELLHLRASRSWRITAPLRRAVELLRSLVPIGVREARIYVPAGGKPFFLEVAELLRAGFTDIGVRSAIVSAGTLEECADAAHGNADLHLVVAPHEFFSLIPEAKTWPHAKGRLWMYNIEQTHALWFDGGKIVFDRADIILDMDAVMAEWLHSLGLNAKHLPLGFSPACRLFDGTAPIPANDATQGIARRIRDWSARANPLEESLHSRPLDCCFFGASTDRHTAFFARNGALFAELESYLRFAPSAGPSPLSTECISSIVRRSKIFLNLHRSEPGRYKWQRMLLRGLWQGALVVSEPCADSAGFTPGIDYIEADLESMPETLAYLLRSEEGRELAERVRRQGYATMRKKGSMGKGLRKVLQQRPKTTRAGA